MVAYGSDRIIDGHDNLLDRGRGAVIAETEIRKRPLTLYLRA